MPELLNFQPSSFSLPLSSSLVREFPPSLLLPFPLFSECLWSGSTGSRIRRSHVRELPKNPPTFLGYIGKSHPKPSRIIGVSSLVRPNVMCAPPWPANLIEIGVCDGRRRRNALASLSAWSTGTAATETSPPLLPREILINYPMNFDVNYLRGSGEKYAFLRDLSLLLGRGFRWFFPSLPPPAFRSGPPLTAPDDPAPRTPLHLSLARP